MRRHIWIMVAFSIYGVAALYLVLASVIHDPISYPFLLVPFLVDQLYLLVTRTRYRLIYTLNAGVVSFAIAVLFYLVVR